MLNQAELNFYGYNQNNIIQRENRGKISVVLKYDSVHNLYVVIRRTPSTIWTDRYKDLNKAQERYSEFLYLTNKQLENNIKNRI